MTVSTAVTARAPAKVNLLLRVGPLREDGYHELTTVFQAVSLLDEVVVTPAETFSVTVEGVHAERVPVDESNLALRAARLIARRHGVERAVRLHIRKQIPVAGGMAGGSADAAAALVACDALWGLGCSREELATLAAQLGSDVPFCLLGGTAIGAGRGERLSPVLASGGYHWVIALGEDGLSTPAVFAEFDRLAVEAERRLQAEVAGAVPPPLPGDDSGPAGPVAPAGPASAGDVPDELMQALRSGDADLLGAILSNDLQPAACSLMPRLERVLTVGRQCGALGAVVSGSGPSVAFLVRGVEHGLDLSVALTASGVVGDVRRVNSPVHGARVVDPGRRG